MKGKKYARKNEEDEEAKAWEKKIQCEIALNRSGLAVNIINLVFHFILL